MASVRFSGRENAVRSMSSYQGRACEKVWRAEVVRRERKLRKAGVVIGVLLVVSLIGRIAGDDIADDFRGNFLKG